MLSLRKMKIDVVATKMKMACMLSLRKMRMTISMEDENGVHIIAVEDENEEHTVNAITKHIIDIDRPK